MDSKSCRVRVIAIALSLASCGPAAGTGAPVPASPTSTPTPGIAIGTSSGGSVSGVAITDPNRLAPAPPTAGPPINGVLTLSDNDERRTITVGRGVRIHVALAGAGSAYTWSSLASDTPNVVAPTNIPTAGVTADGWFVAQTTGKAMLFDTDKPNCGHWVPPCMSPEKSFEVTLIVTD